MSSQSEAGKKRPFIDHDIKLDFNDVLFRPQRSTLKSRQEVNLEREITFLHSRKTWSGTPLISSNMDTTGTFEMGVSLSKYKCLTTIHKYYSPDDWKIFAIRRPEALPYVAISAGTSQRDFEIVKQITENIPDLQMICLDVANGYSQYFVDTVAKYRQAFPKHVIMAGNVVTGEMTQELIESGADIIKIGIGPGSVCTTRKQTGVGYPQLSAVLECAEAAHELGGHVISDGGCVTPGDVAKALGAGGDFVMIGGMFGGHDESGGEIFIRDGQLFKKFYGMSSTTAMNKYSGGVAEYRSSEGKTVEMPYKGPVEATLLDILGGVRSTCTYVGAKNVVELANKTSFIRVNRQLNESLSNLRTDLNHGYARLKAQQLLEASVIGGGN